MKTSFAAITTAVFGLASTAAANTCHWNLDLQNPIFRTWLVIANDVDDIPGKCGGFWDNMNNSDFNGACVLSQTNCGENSEGQMVINFVSGSGCNSGHVESAWWEATRNNYGGIECRLE